MPLHFEKTKTPNDPHSPFSDDDYIGKHGGLGVGRIYKITSGGSFKDIGRWHWGFHIGSVKTGGPQAHGITNTLDEAKAKMQDAWKVWLAWAKLREDEEEIE